MQRHRYRAMQYNSKTVFASVEINSRGGTGLKVVPADRWFTSVISTGRGGGGEGGKELLIDTVSR